MSETANLVSVTIEGKGGTARVFIPAGEAAQLANATGCVVRVEQVYRPAQVVAMASRLKGTTVQGSAPVRILQRMSGSPERSFRAADLLDLGLNAKRIHSTLFRLAEQGKIERTGPGLFRIQRGAGARSSTTVAATGDAPSAGATSQANVMAFMRKHPRTPLRAMEVARGMGLTAEFRPSISSSLKRLAAKGDVIRSAGQFTLSEEGAR